MEPSPGDHIQLQNVLWHSSTASPIVSFGNKGNHATSFSDPVETIALASFYMTPV